MRSLDVAHGSVSVCASTGGKGIVEGSSIRNKKEEEKS